MAEVDNVVSTWAAKQIGHVREGPMVGVDQQMMCRIGKMEQCCVNN